VAPNIGLWNQIQKPFQGDSHLLASALFSHDGENQTANADNYRQAE
jgi:hypothetical protein